MSKYTAEQVRACILAYKNGDLNYCRSGIIELLTEYAAILDAEGDGGAVAWFTDDHLSDKSATTYSKEVADRWSAKGWPVNPLYPHPARSGGVSDADVRYLVSKAMRRAWSLGQTYWQQADSESWKQQDKSSDTQRKFDALIEETLAAIQGERHE